MNQISRNPTTSSSLPSTTTTSRAIEVAQLVGADLTRLQRLANALERTSDGRWQLPDTSLPAPGDRHWLEARNTLLQRSLTRANLQAIESVVGEMFLRFPPAGPANDRMGKIAVYAADLQGFPLWAVERALSAVRGPYAPASPMLVDAVRKVLEPTLEEQMKVRRLLTADVYHVPSEDERSRVAARFDKLKADLALNKAFDPPKDTAAPRYASPQNSRQQAEAWLAKEAGGPKAPITLGPEALRSVGVVDRNQDEQQGEAA